MNIRLGRFALFLTGTILLLLIFLARPLMLYAFMGKTKATVIAVSTYYTHSRYSATNIPRYEDKLQYEVNGHTYTFTDLPSDAPSAIGSRYWIIYNTLFPFEASAETIRSSICRKLLIVAVLFIPWLAFSTSFIGKGESLVFKGWRLKLDRTARELKE
jgi:hypothetical protein